MPKRKKASLWIREAIKEPGSLKAYVHWKFGEEGFTKRHTIKIDILQNLSNMPGITGQRARLALNVRKTGE